MLPWLKYSVMRLALFVGSLWLLYFLGAGPLVALIGAAVVSFLLSYVLLRGPREQVAAQIAERVERRHRRATASVDEDAAHEDAADDAARSAAPPADRP